MEGVRPVSPEESAIQSIRYHSIKYSFDRLKFESYPIMLASS